MKINMNQKVKVKLSDYGYKCLKEYAEYFYSGIWNTSSYIKNVEEFIENYKNQEDIRGYIEFQIWELFQYFGEFHYLGIFKNNEIIILEDN